MPIKTRIKKPLISLITKEYTSMMTLARNTNVRKQEPTLNISTCLGDSKKSSIKDKKKKNLQFQYPNQWLKEARIKL